MVINISLQSTSRHIYLFKINDNRPDGYSEVHKKYTNTRSTENRRSHGSAGPPRARKMAYFREGGG